MYYCVTCAKCLGSLPSSTSSSLSCSSTSSFFCSFSSSSSPSSFFSYSSSFPSSSCFVKLVLPGCFGFGGGLVAVKSSHWFSLSPAFTLESKCCVLKTQKKNVDKSTLNVFCCACSLTVSVRIDGTHSPPPLQNVSVLSGPVWFCTAQNLLGTFARMQMFENRRAN